MGEEITVRKQKCPKCKKWIVPHLYYWSPNVLEVMCESCRQYIKWYEPVSHEFDIFGEHVILDVDDKGGRTKERVFTKAETKRRWDELDNSDLAVRPDFVVRGIKKEHGRKK